MIKLLINAKANIYAKDMNNQTVMDLETDEEIRNLLENKIQISPISLVSYYLNNKIWEETKLIIGLNLISKLLKNVYIKNRKRLDK